MYRVITVVTKQRKLIANFLMRLPKFPISNCTLLYLAAFQLHSLLFFCKQNSHPIQSGLCEYIAVFYSKANTLGAIFYLNLFYMVKKRVKSELVQSSLLLKNILYKIFCILTSTVIIQIEAGLKEMLILIQADILEPPPWA